LNFSEQGIRPKTNRCCPGYGAVDRLGRCPRQWKILTSGKLFAIILVMRKIAIAWMIRVDF
jgi:hypothetical protein